MDHGAARPLCLWVWPEKQNVASLRTKQTVEGKTTTKQTKTRHDRSRSFPFSCTQSGEESGSLLAFMTP